MSLYKRGETWWIYVTHDGRRIRRSTGETDKREAQKIHDQVKADLWQKQKSGHTLADALKLWLKASERTQNEKNAVKQFLSVYPSRPLQNMDGHAIQDAFADKSPATYNRIMNNIRAAITLAVERGWCEPIAIPRRKVDSNRLRWLTRIEWKRLETELPPHARAMATFALATGLRQANVLCLKWQDVDMEKNIAWVDGSESKSKKPIPVPLSLTAAAILKAQEGKHAAYVFTWNGKPVRSVKTAWNKALIRANIDVVDTGEKDANGLPIIKSTFRWHDLRHTWASWHVMNGTPLAVLKELGGWHSMEMVMRYAHLAPDHIKQWAGNAVA